MDIYTTWHGLFWLKTKNTFKTDISKSGGAGRNQYLLFDIGHSHFFYRKKVHNPCSPVHYLPF